MIIYYYNDVIKHDGCEHLKCRVIDRNALNVNNSELIFDKSDNIVIDNDDNKYDRNIYIITYQCQIEILQYVNIISELMKSFKKCITFRFEL